MKKTFEDKVLGVIKKIKPGFTMSYGEIAKKSGSPGAARAVGNIVSKNKDFTIPCHRVIKSNGELGSYNGLRGNKEEILKQEGAI